MSDERDDKLMQAAARLATDIAPQRDLWAGIADAIEKPPQRRWSPMFAQAAAVLLLVGGSSFVTYSVMKEDVPAGPQVVSADMVFEQAAYANLGPSFIDARDSLVDELNIELAKLSADDRASIEDSLTLIHEAIAEMNTALEADPENAQLQEKLLRTYREELMLLRRVGGLTRNVMLRNDI